jgi:ATP-dependent RNA helicase DeaD
MRSQLLPIRRAVFVPGIVSPAAFPSVGANTTNMMDTLSAPAGFAGLGLDARLVETLVALGYEEPTPIQEQVIPTLLSGRDLLGQAATGTGKTAAFALPLLQRLLALPLPRPRPGALVLVPTRELAIQVTEAIRRYGKGLGLSILAVYGGQAISEQIPGLRRGVDVVVATPGRANDLVRRGALDLTGVSVVVLDEADEMLDMGFAEDIDALLGATPRTRQTMLFSATMPPRAMAVARHHLDDPAEVRLAARKAGPGEVAAVRQSAYLVDRAHKAAALARILAVEAPAATLVFCRTRAEVDELVETLTTRGLQPEALHGGMSQEHRDRVMRRFRAGAANLVVATDVAARGLDVGHLSHVVNYHVPSAAEDYVHRIGRVGRAGRSGVAITLAEPREQRLLRGIERNTGRRFDMARLPTRKDLELRQLERTAASLREILQAGELETYRSVLESLIGEFDSTDIALAALKLAHGASAGPETTTEDIPVAGQGGHPPRSPGPSVHPPRSPGGMYGKARLSIGLGWDAGVGPRDLVGAIANEAGLAGREICVVEINDRFALVDVPEEAAEHVVAVLRGSRIKGRKVPIRRERRGWEG